MLFLYRRALKQVGWIIIFLPLLSTQIDNVLVVAQAASSSSITMNFTGGGVSNRPATSAPVTTATISSQQDLAFSADSLANSDTNDNLVFQSNNRTICDGLYAFERTLDSAVSPALILNEANRTRSVLINTTSQSQLTFPCNKLCQDAEHCVAYITDYNNARCLLLYQRPKQSRAEFVPLAGLAYYEKICLKIPRDMQCNKEWAFERVVGMQLQNNDDKVLHNLHNRMECMSSCLMEESFICRSARYNYQTNDCFLSRHTRRTLPSAFHTTTDQVDYLENQCAPEPQLCEYHAVEDKLFSVEKQLDNVSNMTSCQSLCRNTDVFVCRAYRYDEGSKECLLSADDRSSISTTTDQGQQQFLGFMERAECIDISMSCGPVSMTAILKLNRPFNGRFYPADKPNQCVVVGNNDFEVQLAMSLEGEECGTKSLGNGSFINDVVVQMHPIVLRDSDRRVRIACDYPSSKVTLTDDLSVAGVPPRFMDPNQVNVTQTVSGIAALPKVRLQIRNGGSGKEVQGAQLGDSLILSIDMVDEASAFGISASDLVAMSGSGDETLQLLDGRGCPVEPSIFPNLAKVHDGRTLTSRFAAFKFASDSIVKFRVTVSFCLDSCPMPDCSLSSVRKRRSPSAGATIGIGNNSLPVDDDNRVDSGKKENYQLELAILVDSESNKAPTIGKDGVVNEAQGAKLKTIICTKTALIWGLGLTAVVIQVITLSCCIASISLYRRLKKQKGDIFECPSATTQTTLAWSSASASNNPDLYRMYK